MLVNKHFTKGFYTDTINSFKKNSVEKWHLEYNGCIDKAESEERFKFADYFLNELLKKA